MNVQELIAELSEYPPDMEVLTKAYDRYGNPYFDAVSWCEYDYLSGRRIVVVR